MSRVTKPADALFRVAEIGRDGITTTNHFGDETAAEAFFERREPHRPLSLIMLAKKPDETWKIHCSIGAR